MNPFPIVKFVGTWVCIVASSVLIVLGMPVALAAAVGILAIAFAMAPTVL
jgi:hypothetical protein